MKLRGRENPLDCFGEVRHVGSEGRITVRGPQMLLWTSHARPSDLDPNPPRDHVEDDRLGSHLAPSLECGEIAPRGPE